MSTIKITEEMIEALAIAEADSAKPYDRRSAGLSEVIQIIERDYSVVPRPSLCKSELAPNYSCELEDGHEGVKHLKVTSGGTRVEWWDE